MKEPKDKLSDDSKKTFLHAEDICRVLPHKRYALKSGHGYVIQQTLRAAYQIFKEEHA